MEEKFYTPDEKLLQHMDLIRPFADMEIDSPLFKMWAESWGDKEKWKEMMEDSNLVLMFHEIQLFEQLDKDDSVFKRAMINILKLRLILYASDGYFRTRIGYDMWYMATMADANSYYPLMWEDHFEPSRWYMPGQPPRGDEIQRLSTRTGTFAIPEEYNVKWKPDREIG